MGKRKPIGYRSKGSGTSRKVYPVYATSGRGRGAPGQPRQAYRTFAGKRYKLGRSIATKKDAIESAEFLRRQGQAVRIVKTVDGYTLYWRTKKSNPSKSLFFPAKHKKYADIVTFDTRYAAEDATNELLREFRSAKTRSKKVRILRVTVAAANRAEASSSRKDIDPDVAYKLKRISSLYRAASKNMLIPKKR